MGVLWLVAACLILIILVYIGIHEIVATLISVLFLVITCNLNFVEALFTGGYTSGILSFFQSSFLMLIMGAVMGELYLKTNMAKSMAAACVKIFGGKWSQVGMCCFCMLLGFAGISSYVIMFATLPVYWTVNDMTKTSRQLSLGASSIASVLTSGAVPFSLGMLNYINAEIFGTSLGAAPVFGFAICITYFVFCIAYIHWERRREWVKNGVDYKNEIYGKKLELEAEDGVKLPAWYLGLVPLVVAFAVALLAEQTLGSGYSVAVGITCATITIYIIGLVTKSITMQDFSAVFTAGATRGTMSCVAVGVLVGFGTVARMTEGFASVVAWVFSFKMNPYLNEILGLSVIAAIFGSAPPTTSVWGAAMAKPLLEQGANAGAMHRLATIAAQGANTLPHSANVIISLRYSNFSYKEAYFPVFMTTVVAPILVSLIFAGVATIVY